MPRYIPHHTDRKQLFLALERTTHVDMIVVGGGATGLGVALDAATRGLKVVLLEAQDFGQGTSSRATKLFHGGVRYLAQGNLSLVREALAERATLLHLAPHLAHAIPFVMPAYRCWEIPFYGAGLKTYDLLTGSKSLGSTQLLSRMRTQIALPNLNLNKLKGGVMYWDAQFDDARYALALARTAAAHSALLINYCPVDSFIVENQRVVGVHCIDAETQQSYELRARCVVNATGVWVDNLRKLLPSARGAKTFEPLVATSQGVHIVVDREFLGADQAMLIPKTRDGRVLFAVPWLGKVILGTTDTKRQDMPLEPRAYQHEIDLILSEASRYLAKTPTMADVRSVWVGLRPLVLPQGKSPEQTKSMSREHLIHLDEEGLLTVTGGKWTTYRTMAEDVIEQCVAHRLLPANLPRSKTNRTQLVGASVDLSPRFVTQAADLRQYGTEAGWVQSLPGNDREILPGLTEAMVRFAVRFEYARTVEDVLARRSRWLFLDAQEAVQVAAAIDALMQDEGVLDPQLAAFIKKCEQYSGQNKISN